MRLIKNLINNRKVIFDQGKFDDWCVYVVESNGTKKAPYDVDYFTDLQNVSRLYPQHKVYNDFLEIYTKTNHTINMDVLGFINNIVFSYQPQHRAMIEQWFTVIYAGMIAEENKKFAILKKRIKHLGMYQILIQNLQPEFAAKFSYGKKWRELDTIMTPLGI